MRRFGEGTQASAVQLVATRLRWSQLCCDGDWGTVCRAPIGNLRHAIPPLKGFGLGPKPIMGGPARSAKIRNSSPVVGNLSCSTRQYQAGPCRGQ